MLSLNYLKSFAQAASNYYQVVTRQKDDTPSQHIDYYCRKPGEWFGRTAKILGYKDAVTEKHFVNLIEGRSKSGHLLVEPGNNGIRRGGYDLTFSAPKSISIMAELAADSDLKRQIYQAHEQSVKSALAYLEEHYAQTRITVHGQTERVNTANLAMAIFTENTSRSQDPQIHSHSIVFNITQRHDGQFRAIMNEPLHYQKMLLGQTYRNEFAKQLTTLGFAIDQRPRGLFEIKGVSEEALREFSTRSDEIEQRLPELRKKNPRMNESKLRELAAIQSRDRKQDISPRELREQWQRRLAKLNIEPEKMLEAAQNQPAQTIKPTNHIDLALELLTQQESLATKEQLLDMGMKLSMGQKNISDLEAELFKSESLRTVVKDKLFTSREIQQIERDIVQQVKNSYNQSEALFSYDLMPMLHKQEIFSSLTQDQQQALQFLLTTKDRICGIQGDAGTGKTHLLKLAAECYVEQGYGVMSLAPTTRAVEELQKHQLPNAQTIQRFLVRQETSKAKSPRVFIIDESSMLGSKQLHNILKQTSERDRIIMVGDTKQLQSIEAGGIFTKLQTHKVLHSVRLAENIRQKNELTLKVATALAERNVAQAFELLEKHDKIKEIEDNFERLTAAADEYVKHFNGKESLAVVETNAERIQLNDMIRNQLIEHGEVKDGGVTVDILLPKNSRHADRNLAHNYEVNDRFFITEKIGKIGAGSHGKITGVHQTENSIECVVTDKHRTHSVTINLTKHGHHLSASKQESRSFAKGDKLMFLKADSGLRVQNGTTAEVVGIDPVSNYVRVKTDQDRTFTVNPKIYPYLDYAYAVTDYRVQGQTADQVLFVADTRQVTNYNSLYVAATRGQHDLSIFTNDQEMLREQVQIEQFKSSNLDYDLSPALELEQTLDDCTLSPPTR